MSLERRIADLEHLIGQPDEADEGAELRRSVLIDIVNELSRLKASRARNGYRGGKPPTPIQPTDPAGEALGYPYTKGQLLEHAVRLVFERGEASASLEDTERLVAAWTEGLREDTVFGERWDEIEAEGPPERTPPWRGGS
jgi:hypothetical protein